LANQPVTADLPKSALAIDTILPSSGPVPAFSAEHWDCRPAAYKRVLLGVSELW